MCIYQTLMKDWLFTKSNDKSKTRQFGIGGLGYRSEHSLREASKLEVGDSVKLNGYTLTRTK
jgi:hypothetical protein